MFDESGKNWNMTIVPDHFAMGFGLKKYFGFAFGLKPFSRAGYELTQKTKVGSDSIKYIYKGKGGSHEIFLGLSADLIHLKKTQLSVGGNIGYLFGTTLKERQSILIGVNNFVGGSEWKEFKISSLHYEFAASLRQRISENQTLVLTTVIEPTQQLHGKNNSYLFYGNVDAPELLKALNATTNVETTLRQTGKAQFGLAYKLLFKDERKDNTLRNSEVALHFNYTHAFIFSAPSNNPVINQPTGWNAGIQYTPETGIYSSTTKMKLLEKLHYRSGYFKLDLPYKLNDISVRDRGFTFGIGMPVTSFRTLSSINFAFVAGERSNSSVSDYRERYLGFSFGITLAPSNFDKWFVKRKLD